jgi:hypothetical protein
MNIYLLGCGYAFLTFWLAGFLHSHDAKLEYKRGKRTIPWELDVMALFLSSIGILISWVGMVAGMILCLKSVYGILSEWQYLHTIGSQPLFLKKLQARLFGVVQRKEEEDV